MTVSNTTVTTSSNGTGTNGSDGAFSFAIGNIKFSDNSELDVYIRDVGESPPTEALKTITTHYFITDSAGNQVNPGTHIKFDTGSGHTLPLSDQKVVVKRKIELTQNTDYASGDAFPADSHEDALDKLTLLVQQMQEQLDRAWTYPETYSTLANVKMPEPANDGIIKYNADATALVLDTDLVNSTYKLYASNTSDTTAGFLNDKLSAGTGLSKTATTGVENQSVTLSIDLKTSTDLNENSASHAASQQSIKAYVDAVTASLNAQDLDFTTDTVGNSAVDLDTQVLSVLSGSSTGISVTHSGQTITVSGVDASTSVKGVASFNSDSFSASSGAISVKSGAILDAPVLKATSTSAAGKILFKEGTDNGTNSVTLEGAAATADVTVTLPAATDTLVGKATTDTLTNKTLTSPKMNEDVAMTTTSTFLNRMDATSSVQTQLDAKHPTINSGARLDADLIHDGSVSNTEFGHISTLSSNAQTQLDAKQATITGAATTITSSDLTASKALQSNASGKVEASSVSTTTLGYLDATSSVQTQLDAKAPISQPEFTSYVDFDSISAPSAPSDSGDVRLYANNSKLYFHGQGGSATEIGSGGGVGSIDTIFTLQAKSADNASDGSGDDAVFRGAAASITSAPTLDTTAGKLINTEKVFKYASASGSTNDWWLYSQAIPQGYQNRNMVLQLQYYMVETSGDNLNQAFRFVARDATNGKVTQLNGAVSSSNTIVLDAFADGDFTVGDRVTFKDTSSNIHFRYITSVTHGSEQLTISGSAVSIADDSYFVSGILTDELDYLPNFKPTTAGQDGSKAYRKQLVIPSNCDTLEFGFHYLGSETDQFLYYDDIALSANQFLQTSSQGEVEYFSRNQFGGYASSYAPYLTGSYSRDTTKNVIEILNDSTNGLKITALQRCKISCNTRFQFNTANSGHLGWTKNTAIASITTFTDKSVFVSPLGYVGSSLAQNVGVTCPVIDYVLEKGDYIRLLTDGDGFNTADENMRVDITATPLVNDVVLLNSGVNDELFTDWIDNGKFSDSVKAYGSGSGGTDPTAGSTNVDTYKWRRDGSDMIIYIAFDQSSAGSAGSGGDYIVEMPSGYVADSSFYTFGPTTSFGGGNGNNWYAYNDIGGGQVNDDPAGTTNGWLRGFLVEEDKFKFGFGVNYGATANWYGCMGSAAYHFGLTNQAYTAILRIKIAGWTSTFNPVLSMPLVDFGSFENTYSARIANNGSTGTVTSQSENFIASVSRPSTGVVTVTFATGFFSVAPAVNATVENTSNSDRTINVYSVSTTGFSCSIEAPTDFGFRDNDFNVVVVRQGSDYRQPPQPTAAVIKPAVCLLKYVVANNTGGDQAGTPGSWYTRKLNTVEGESWFLDSFASNLFTLQAGSYELEAAASFINTNQSLIGLYNNTDAVFTDYGIPVYVSGTYSDNTSALLSTTFTITSSKAFYLKYRTSNDNGSTDLGNPANFGNIETYTIVKIRKLK